MKKRMRILVLLLVVATMAGTPAVAEDSGCVSQIVPFYLCADGKCVQIGWTFETRCSSGRGATGGW